MKSEIIGEKTDFAVEYSIEYVQSEVVYGGCRLWLKGKYLGDINDYIYLNMFAQTLNWLGYQFNEKNLIDDNILPNLTTKEFIEVWKSDIELDKNAILGIEGFDRFYKLCFRNNKTLLFYWCLDPNVSNNSNSFPQFRNYPEGVHIAEISISLIREVSDKFSAKIKEKVSQHGA